MEIPSSEDDIERAYKPILTFFPTPVLSGSGSKSISQPAVYADTPRKFTQR